MGAVVAVAMAVGVMATPAAAHDGPRHDGGERTEERRERHRDGHDRDGKWRHHRDRHDRGDRGDRDDRWDRDGFRLGEEDRGFVEAAAQIALSEIIQGQLAIDRSEDPVVQEYGRMMMVDHFDQLVEQLPIMRKAEIELPALTEAQMTQMSELAAVESAGFDDMYLQLQVVGHEQAIELFSERAEGGEHRKVRKFAESQLPVLYQHLDAANAALATQEVPVA